MKWPDAPTVHIGGWPPPSDDLTWRAPRRYNVSDENSYTYDNTFRTCGYCGSIHPEDLVNAVKAGAKVGGSDWKYGWPHKFYISGMPNPIAGQIVRVGMTSEWKDGARVTVPTMGAAPASLHAKWYNDHLLDDGYDDEALSALIESLGASGIKFQIEEQRLKYSAPHAGYQR